MLEAEGLADVQRGADELRCPVCAAAVRVARSRAREARAMRDEEALTRLVGELCYGTPPDMVELTTPKYPGETNPRPKPSGLEHDP